MKKIFATVCFAITSIILCSGLSAQADTSKLNLKPFTLDIYDLIKDKGLFQQIDFYNSEELTVCRELRATELSAENGKLIIQNNQRYECIILPQHNVGLFYSDGGKNFYNVSFDPRKPQNHFVFQAYSDNQFYLQYFTDNSGYYYVTYAGNDYYIQNGPAIDASNKMQLHLLFDDQITSKKTTGTDVIPSFPSRNPGAGKH